MNSTIHKQPLSFSRTFFAKPNFIFRLNTKRDNRSTKCRLIPTTWEWSEDIDVARAEEAKKRAEDKLSQSGMDDKEVKLAEAKLHRALVRIGTVGK